MMKQMSVLAKDVQPGDYMMFGNEMMRIYTGGYATVREYPRMGNHDTPMVVIALISDLRYGTASEVIVDCYLGAEHPVTVFRELR